MIARVDNEDIPIAVDEDVSRLQQPLCAGPRERAHVRQIQFERLLPEYRIGGHGGRGANAREHQNAIFELPDDEQVAVRIDVDGVRQTDLVAVDARPDISAGKVFLENHARSGLPVSNGGSNTRMR